MKCLVGLLNHLVTQQIVRNGTASTLQHQMVVMVVSTTLSTNWLALGEGSVGNGSMNEYLFEDDLAQLYKES